MRHLTEEEIAELEARQCTATDWGLIEVSEGFTSADIRNVCFEGAVRLGAHVRLTDVGVIRTTSGATYGLGYAISVLCEAGEGSVVSFPGLTAQIAELMMRYKDDEAVWQRLRDMALREVEAIRPPCTTIADGAAVSGTRELTNVLAGPRTEITGAFRLTDCTLASRPEASILIGDGAILENTVIQAGSSVTDNASLYDSFVGEACHMIRSFTADSSVFFANSFFACGEAVAAFCGPFSVSHHKSTLLIGCQTAFYNAGSGTNFSNHAYKMGPIHWGRLGRGTKTGSGAYVMWPAQTAPFSLIKGRIETHPDTRLMPFSYIVSEGRNTRLIPGRNLMTVGTYRDVEKWTKRDARPRNGRRTLVNYDWLSPYIVDTCLKGRDALRALQEEQGENTAYYTYNGTLISHHGVVMGQAYYDLVLRLALRVALKEHEATLPTETAGVGEWDDLLGMYAPASEIAAIIDDIRSGRMDDIAALTAALADIHSKYAEYKWAWVYRQITQLEDLDTITPADREQLIKKYAPDRGEWLDAVRRDAKREHDLGDVARATLQDFLDSVGLQA